MTAKATTSGDSVQLVPRLLEIGGVDTVYRDVYLARAATLLGARLSAQEFQQLERQRAEVAEIQPAIAHAVERGNWAGVKELSERVASLRQALEDNRALLETARAVYAVGDVKLDPFSPGLQGFARVAIKDLPRLRNQAMEQLAGLAEADPPWRDFYAQRRDAFRALVVATDEQAATTQAAASPRDAAMQALKFGDMKSLAQLAETVLAGTTSPAGRAPAPGGPTTPTAKPDADLLVSFSDDTLGRAKRLGLVARRLESRTELAPLRAHAWNPLFSDESGQIGTKHVTLPAGTPEAFRERLEMLMIHPLVNSGGARHLPTLVAEDVLVEDFSDPAEDEQPPRSELLVTLGLPARRGVTRLAIERGLLAHGHRVVGDGLGLDPHAFRLVCIPPDVHLRLGEAQGWGRQPLWTHFDGYLIMADGRLRALAGGNARFGGLYNLLGLSRDYDSDRVFARFAVVRRGRMVAW